MRGAVAVGHDPRWGYQRLDARRYDRRRYGSPLRRLNQRFLDRALGRALEDVPPGGLVLDAPCGTGVLGRALRARGLRVVGLDISAAMLEVARGRGGLGHVRADLDRLPWRDRSFDAVVCNRFLMHLPPARRTEAFASLARLTDGPLIATVCHPYTTKSMTRRLRRFLGWRSVGWRVKESPRLTRAELAAEVAAAGLHLERVERVMPLFSEVWVAVITRPAATSYQPERGDRK
jgi:SAM-dependent methyltransferase